MEDFRTGSASHTASCHRVDGPAYEGSDGSKYWYLNGKHITKLTKKMLINYMKANNYILAHLLTDPESIVREATLKYMKEMII